MSPAPTDLVERNFERAMIHCDNLIKVHQQAGKGGSGRRWTEASINRAVIVLAIASWQSFVQDVTKLLLTTHLPDPADPNYGFARLIEGQVLRELDRFSTPNAENTRNLLKLVGFDPRKYWTWSTKEGTNKGRVLEPRDVEQRLRDWLSVRHAIAHGDENMPKVQVLQAVRQNRMRQDQAPIIWLNDARNCTAFVRRLAKVTIEGLGTELCRKS